jgi:hypothetical protein
VVNEQTQSWTEEDDISETAADVFSLHENVQFNTLPLLALANQAQYRSNLLKFTRECNKIYQEFLNSDEGYSFDGQVGSLYIIIK